MDAYQKAIADVVEEIAAEMKRLELWEEEQPERERLVSGQPFCYDTLHFHQWLQWLFVPRMRRILSAGGQGMPRESAIRPYADECLRVLAQDTGELLWLIGAFDELITTGGEVKHGGDTNHH